MPRHSRGPRCVGCACDSSATRAEEVSLRVGDAVVATKAGQHPHGLDRFVSSLSGKPVPWLACFPCSLLSTPHRRSFPIRVDQVVRRDTEQSASQANTAAQTQAPSGAKRRPGPPTGRQNPPTAAATFTPVTVRITGRLGALRPVIAGVVALPDVGLDGHWGHHHALGRARPTGPQAARPTACAARLVGLGVEPASLQGCLGRRSARGNAASAEWAGGPRWSGRRSGTLPSRHGQRCARPVEGTAERSARAGAHERERQTPWGLRRGHLAGRTRRCAAVGGGSRGRDLSCVGARPAHACLSACGRR